MYIGAPRMWWPPSAPRQPPRLSPSPVTEQGGGGRGAWGEGGGARRSLKNCYRASVELLAWLGVEMMCGAHTSCPPPLPLTAYLPRLPATSYLATSLPRYFLLACLSVEMTRGSETIVWSP